MQIPELTLLQTRRPEFTYADQVAVYYNNMADPDGKVSNVRVIKGVDRYLDEEALRVVSSSPDWTPGKHNARPVRVRFSIPINFKLQ